MTDWFQSPPGQYLLDWERAQFEAALADVFGYHALQVGLGDIDALAANRMPHRWLALDGAGVTPVTTVVGGSSAQPEAVSDGPVGAIAIGQASLWAEYPALPFSENSLDLVILPHTLELNADPHATLREVGRVLVPEGRVVIS